ncbi:unnamed protein product [Dicrocoelium dendriticum]|nr:unnamed protein product [Dicrocoelium dendriticum]
MNKKLLRINTLCFEGPTATGKSLILNLICQNYNYGTIQRSGDHSQFFLQNLVHKSVALMEEPRITPITVQGFEKLLAGSSFDIHVKHSQDITLRRLPVLISTNHKLSKYIPSVDAQATYNRCHTYIFSVTVGSPELPEPLPFYAPATLRTGTPPGGELMQVDSTTNEDELPDETGQSTSRSLRLLRSRYYSIPVTITRTQHITINQYKPGDNTDIYAITCLPTSTFEFWYLAADQTFAENFGALRQYFPLCTFDRATHRISHHIPLQKSLQSTTATDITAFNTAPYTSPRMTTVI